MSIESEKNEIQIFAGGIIFPESALDREKNRKGRTLDDIRNGRISLSELASRIHKVLHDPHCDGDDGHKARAAIVYKMKDAELTEDEAFWVCEHNRYWSDYKEEITRSMIHSMYVKKNGNINGNANERGEKPSAHARDFPPSLPLSSKNQSIEELIKEVKWREPEAKPEKESIKHYFINNPDIYSYQHAPDAKHEKWYYTLVETPLSQKHIWRHLETALNPKYEKQFTLGAHEQDKEGKGKWLCFDIDEKDEKNGSNLRNAYLIIGYFESRGISAMLENASEGIESYHIWVFCEPTDTRVLKAIGEAALEATGIKCEVSPKCDPKNPIGNLVRIPFGLNRKREAKSKILTYDKGVACALFNTKPLLPNGA